MTKKLNNGCYYLHIIGADFKLLVFTLTVDGLAFQLWYRVFCASFAMLQFQNFLTGK